MNFAIIRNILGKIMMLLGCLLILPLFICLIYQESWLNYVAFLVPMALLFALGFLCNLKKAKSSKLLAREGFIVVGMSWFVLTFFGCFPLMISGEIPNFFDAFFEMASGFTTTGASVVPDVTKLSHSILIWRSFSHWIGGMGVLVFILALVPESQDGSSIHILRAESTGPQVGKLVSKMKASARILYLIYISMTCLQILFLWLGPDEKMGLFQSLFYSLGTAGTGGFAMDADCLASYSAYSQYVISAFMILFGVNFSVYYLVLLGKFKEIFKNDELKSYGIILFVAVLLICINTYSLFENVELTFRNALFHVASLISTTGYAISDYDLWPSMSKVVLVFIMISGACAGSTAGGVKISRVNTLAKGTFREVRSMINPRKVETVRENGKPITNTMVHSVQTFFCTYIALLLICTLLISWDDFTLASGATADLTTHFSASLTCISNVGPGFSLVGPACNFSAYSGFSKMVLSIEMIAGRLEIFPVILLFCPSTWKRN